MTFVILHYIYIFIHSFVFFETKVDCHELPSNSIFRCPSHFHSHRARPPIEYNEKPLLPALFLFCFPFMTSSKRRYDCHELPYNSFVCGPSHSPPHRARLPIEYNEKPLLPAPFCFLFMTYPQRLFYVLGPQNQHNKSLSSLFRTHGVGMVGLL